jgi:protein phosphatase
MPDDNTPSGSTELPALDDLSAPLEIELTPEPLGAGVRLATPDRTVFVVGSCLRTESGRRLYEGLRESDGRSVWIREAWTPEGTTGLNVEAEVLASVQIRMFAEMLASWAEDGRVYLVTDIRPGPTMEEALKSRNFSFVQALSAITQVAYALSRLHDAGWILLGLRPSIIVPGMPASITSFGDCVRAGDRPRREFFYSGYSSPEVFKGQPANPRMDIYGIGALLFHAVTRNPMAETGAELTTFSPPAPVGGVPQILRLCLEESDACYTTMAELHKDLLRLLKSCSPQLSYEIVSRTNIGLEPSRKTNQDSCGFLMGRTEGDEGLHAWAFLALADGMGGMESGEIASQTAIRALLNLAATNARTIFKGEDRYTELKRWASVANEDVCNALERQKAHGGTTLVCALVCQSELISAHVGDSRLYLVRGGKAQVLTRDHSLAMSLAIQGDIPLEEVRHHPDRNRVTRSLGERIPMPDYYADTLQVTTGCPSMMLDAGDLLVLCSDGVWEPVTDDEIASCASESSNLNTIARRLIDLTLQRGAPDNATVVLLRIHEEQTVTEGEQ